ncbi:hypothetical protein [Arthrobacter sp. NA-172]
MSIAGRTDQDEEQFSAGGSSGEEFGLLRIRRNHHEAVRLAIT